MILVIILQLTILYYKNLNSVAVRLWEKKKLFLFYFYSDEIANASSKSKHVPLSSSVAVPVLKPTQYSSSQIQVVHALEETFKPRYKSDYFSQDGTIRKPRYVADQKGNHYVSLRVISSLNKIF